MKKNKRNKYKIGFYVMDTYTNDKQFHVKGLNFEDAEKCFKEAMKKYR